MANRYWVGGTSTWDATAGSKWSLTSGGAGGQTVPTAADDVFFSSASTGTCTISAAAVCRSLTCTGFTGTIAGSSALTVGTTTAGNITLVSGMTWSYTGTLTKTSSGTCTLTTGGKTLTTFVNSGTGTLTLGDDLTVGTFTCSGTNTNNFNSKNITWTTGFTVASGTTIQNPANLTWTGTGTNTFTPANKTFGNIIANGTGTLGIVGLATCNKFEIIKGSCLINGTTVTCNYFIASGTQTRSLNLVGGGKVVVLDSEPSAGQDIAWDVSSSTNFSMSTSSGSLISFTKTGTQNFIGGGKSYGDVAFSPALYGVGYIDGANTFGTLTLNKMYLRQFQNGTTTCTNFTVDAQTFASGLNVAVITLNSNLTVSGTITLTGNTTNRLFLYNPNRSPTITVTCNGTWTCQYLDLSGITGAGSATRNLSAITGLSGDAGSNSGFTFTTAITAYWYQNGGNWFDSSKWFLATNGGGGAARVPLPQDTATFDANSFSTSTQVINVDNYFRNPIFDATNVTNNPKFSTLYGVVAHKDLKMGTATWDVASLNFVGTDNSSWSGGSATITISSVTSNKPSASLTFASNINIGGTFLQNAGGTINFNGYNFTGIAYATAGTTNFGSGTHNVGVYAEGGNVNQQTSTVNLLGYSYHGVGTASLNTVTIPYTGSPTSIAGALSVTNITIAPAVEIQFESGSSITVSGTFTAVGASGNLIKMYSDNPGVGTWTLSKSSGVVSADYLDLADSIATGGATYYAGANSTNSGNNSGWAFMAAPPPGSIASAAGTSVATAVGKTVKKALGSAAGVAAGAAVGKAKRAAIGAAAGSAAGGFVGKTVMKAVASASGTSVVTGAAKPVTTAAAAGTSTAQAVGRAKYKATAAAVGTSTVQSTSKALKKATASSVGTSAPSFSSKTVMKTAANSAGVGIASATGKSNNKAVASAVGTSTVTGVANPKFKGVASASGTSTVQATGRPKFKGVASASGTSTVQATGRAQKRMIGNAVGVSTVQATSKTVMKTVGSSTSTSTVTAVGKTGKKGRASSVGTSTVQAVGNAKKRSIGSSVGRAATVNAVSRFNKNLYVPMTTLTLRGGANRFSYSVIRFSGESIPIEHVQDAQKLDGDAYVDLFQVILSDKMSKLYLKMNGDVSWQGNKYEGTGVKIDGVATYASEEVSRPKLSLFNPEGVYSSLVDDGLLDGAKVIRYRVLKVDIDNDRPIYRVQQWKVSRVAELRVGSIILELRDLLDGQTFMVPYRMFIPPNFPTVSVN